MSKNHKCTNCGAMVSNANCCPYCASRTPENAASGKKPVAKHLLYAPLVLLLVACIVFPPLGAGMLRTLPFWIGPVAGIAMVLCWIRRQRIKTAEAALERELRKNYYASQKNLTTNKTAQ